MGLIFGHEVCVACSGNTARLTACRTAVNVVGCRVAHIVRNEDGR